MLAAPPGVAAEPKEVHTMAKLLALVSTSRDHPTRGDNHGPLGAHSARDEKTGHA
jgi:hypothetical protein